MDTMGITHILSLGVRARKQPEGLVEALFIDIEDFEEVEIYPHLPRAVEFIENAIE